MAVLSVFLLSRNLYVRRRVKFTCRNKIEAMYGRSRVRCKLKVEPRSTFTFTRDLSYIASILFTHLNFTRPRTRVIFTIART